MARLCTTDRLALMTLPQVSPEALRLLASEAMTDIAHLLRPGHLQQLSNILKDSEARLHAAAPKSAALTGHAPSAQASPNDRFVALELLKNANVAAGMVLPGCQDTGARAGGRTAAAHPN